MPQTRLTIPLLIWTGWLLVALVFRFGPEPISQRLREQFQSVTGMSLTLCEAHVVRPLCNVLSREQSDKTTLSSPAAAGSDDLLKLTAENRALRAAVADLQQQLQRQGPQKTLIPVAALQQVDLLETRALGTAGDPWRSNRQHYIDLGRQAGLLHDDLVLQGEGILIDAGQDQGLNADQLVTAGRSLFGRTLHTGPWTSTVQPVTDRQFRIAAQIIRNSELGPVQGPRGIIEGTGTGCRLNEVAATEAVAVGDDVYTDPLVSPNGEAIYLGRVTLADIGVTATQWTINVVPVTAAGEVPRRLSVLRTRLNRDRLVQWADGRSN